MHVPKRGSDVRGKKHRSSREGLLHSSATSSADKSASMEHNELILLLMQLATKCCCKQDFTLFHFF